MKISSTKLFAGFIFIVILWKAKTDVHPCNTYTNRRNLLLADCSNTNLTKVPQDLDNMVMALDMSQNRIEDFDAFTFKAYSKLTHLKMTNLLPVENKKYIPHDEKMFDPLTSLVNLDISHSRFTDHPKFQWPLKLEKLAVAGDRIDELDLTTLGNLRQLDASGNMIKDFPKLNLTAPIHWIDLSGNPLFNVTAEHLAPFCQLDYLGLQVSSGGQLTYPQFFCECSRLEKWMLDNSIEGARSFFCFNDTYGGPKTSCNLTFDSELTKQYNECLVGLPASPLQNLFVYLMIFSLIFPILYLANFTYQKYKQKKKKKEEELLEPEPEPEPEPPSADPSSTADDIEVEMGQSQPEPGGSQYNAQ